jgi:hypothetical protein
MVELSMAKLPKSGVEADRCTAAGIVPLDRSTLLDSEGKVSSTKENTFFAS